MKTILSTIMKTAWKFFRTTGMNFSECLKKSWKVFKLTEEMKKGIVKFYFQKVDGTTREAWGTLKSELLPESTGSSSRKQNDTVQTYFDTEVQEFRCFKKLNLINIAA